MPQCPNCGRKTHYGTYCLWCHYPLIRHRFAGYGKKRVQPTGASEQPIIPVEKIIDDIQQRAITDAEKESTRIISESKQTTEQLVREISEQVEREYRRILEEAVQKISEEIGEEDELPAMLTDNAAVQGFQPDRPLPSDTLIKVDHQQDEVRRVPITRQIRVFIIDRDFFFSRGLRRYLSRSNDIEVIGTSENFTGDTLLMVDRLRPDVVLVDIDLPSAGGFELTRQVLNRFPAMPVIILTPYANDEQILLALESGATGYLEKDTTAEGFADAIRRVSAEEHIISNLLTIPAVAREVRNQFQDTIGIAESYDGTLDEQEMDMLGYLADGYSSEQVADSMVMSNQAMKDALASIRRKLLVNVAFFPEDIKVGKQPL